MAAGSLTKASVVTPRARLVAEKLNRIQTTAFRSQQRETTKAGCLEVFGGRGGAVDAASPKLCSGGRGYDGAVPLISMTAGL